MIVEKGLLKAAQCTNADRRGNWPSIADCFAAASGAPSSEARLSLAGKRR
jgi:hypothetical protein